MCRSYYLPTDTPAEGEKGALRDFVLPEELKPTEPEIMYLESCLNRRMITTAFPIGLLCGLIGYFGAINGKFLHPRYGAGPATIGVSFLTMGFAGYWVQELCVKEVIEKFPEGNARWLNPDLLSKQYIESGESK